jgi:hypothetical protein
MTYVGVTLSGANTHDIKLLEGLLAHTRKGRRYVLMRGMGGHKKVPKGWDMKRTSDLVGREAREGTESRFQRTAVGRGGMPFMVEPL